MPVVYSTYQKRVLESMKIVIIHGGVDDFTTQPAGNSGERIACGVIKKVI